MVVKPIINLATKYTDDVIGIGVRKWTKPTNLEGLRLAPSATVDSFSSTIKNASETFLSADSKLFSWAKKKPELSLAKIEPESLVMVHRTNYYPQNGRILSLSETTRKATGVSEYRPTIHTSLNKSVTEHLMGNSWNSMDYSIIMPFKETVSSMPKSKVIGGIQDDFFLMDSITLPKGSVILKRNASIPKDSLKVTEAFDGVKLIETSADDMVGATDLIIKKMGYTPYNEALQKYLGASAEEMKLITSFNEVELADSLNHIAGNLESTRAQIKGAMKSLEEFKDIFSKEDYLASLEAHKKNLRICDIAEKYSKKFNVQKTWESFFSSKGYYSGLHDGTAWAESEKAFVGLSTISKGNKNSWVWDGTDYKIRLLDKLQECKVKIPKGKELGYDVDRTIAIVRNSDTPEIAEKEIMKQLKITGMKPADRSEQMRKFGLDEETIAELNYMRNEAPEEFQMLLYL